MKLKNKILRRFMKLPFLGHFTMFFYKSMGVHFKENSRISSYAEIIGEYANIYMGKNSEINYGAFILAKGHVCIGDNSTIAYKAKIITSANPNGPYNELSKIYPKVVASVKIGENCWVGAGAIILPGVTIGDFSVVAAGAVVNKDVPAGSLVAGVPARVVKVLKK